MIGCCCWLHNSSTLINDYLVPESLYALSPIGGQGAYLLLIATTGFIRAACEAGIIPARMPTTTQMPIDSNILEVDIKMGNSKTIVMIFVNPNTRINPMR